MQHLLDYVCEACIQLDKLESNTEYSSSQLFISDSIIFLQWFFIRICKNKFVVDIIDNLKL